MLSCKIKDSVNLLPYIGLDFMNTNPAFSFGADLNFAEKHNIGLGMLIGTAEWESKVNDDRNWNVSGYKIDKLTFESSCLRFVASYSYFVKKGFYVGANACFDKLNDIKYKVYCKDKSGYYYNKKPFDGTDFVFQIKAGYRFNK